MTVPIELDNKNNSFCLVSESNSRVNSFLICEKCLDAEEYEATTFFMEGDSGATIFSFKVFDHLKCLRFAFELSNSSKTLSSFWLENPLFISDDPRFE